MGRRKGKRSVSKDVSVNIGLHMGSHVIDLRVPRMVRKWHLKRVISEALLMMHMKMPANFDLKVWGKLLEVSGSALYDEYALGDGDQIQIVLKGVTKQ